MNSIIYDYILKLGSFLLYKYLASLTEESFGKLSKQELIARMLKMQNKMES